jgi:hypothetical protein
MEEEISVGADGIQRAESNLSSTITILLLEVAVELEELFDSESSK